MRRRYSFLMRSLSLIAPLWLAKRAKAGKEDPARLSERYGRASCPRPEGQLIWMHGASVGETTMMLPLIKRLLNSNPERSVLVTSGTVTSAKIMASKLPDRAFHQYIPLDAPHYVARFLEHWKPDLAVWAESEIWPNLILQTKAANIPMALINGRLSKKSLAGWAKREHFAKSIFDSFDSILPADKPTAEGLSSILDRDLKAVGNLKYDAPALSFDSEERDTLKEAIGQRKIWVAASIHSEEMDTVIEAQKRIKDVLLLLVPRHPSEAASRMIVADHPDLNIARRSKKQVPNEKTKIYLFDTLGEMGLAYSLGDLAFVGGSLSSTLMGHNPLEPVRLNVPTLTGPHFASFAEVYAPYIENNAIKVIEETDELSQIVTNMLNDPDTREKMMKSAIDIVGRMSGSLDITVETLEGLLQ